MAEDLEKKIKKIFWDRDKGVFWDGYDTVKNIPVKQLSQHTHSWAILLDINKKYHKSWAEKILLPPMKLEPFAQQNIIEASPFFYYYVIEALKALGGYEKKIIDFVKNRWGYMVDNCPTTCWEMWNPEPGYISLCHAWSAHPIVHLIELIGGIKPIGQNWGKIKKLPPMHDINAIKLFVPTISGNIAVEIKDGRAKIETSSGIKVS
jgi:hypothetical protein